MLNRGEELSSSKDLNAAFTDPRTISLAYFQASLLVEHLVDSLRRRRPAQAAARVRQGARHRRGAEDGAQHRFRRAADRLRQRLVETRFGDAARGAEGARRGRELLQGRLPSPARRWRQRTPAAFPCRWCSAARCAKAADSRRGACAAFERAAALVPMATATTARTLQIAEIALREERHRARDRRAAGRRSHADFDNVEAARQLATLMREANVTDPGAAPPGLRADRRDRSVRCGGARDARALALQRNDADTAIREFRAVLALGPVDQAAAHTDLAESYCRAASAPRRASRRWRRSKSRRATSARRTCC